MPWHDGADELNTLTSKMHSAVAVPRIHMLSHLVGVSPFCCLWQVIMFSCERLEGRFHTHIMAYFWHLLWDLEPHFDVCMIGNPPVGQFRAWSMVNDLPQAHVVGNSGGFHPYLKQIAYRRHERHASALWTEIRVLEQQCCLYHRVAMESIHIRSHPHT